MQLESEKQEIHTEFWKRNLLENRQMNEEMAK
jgi:hypothetical protein